MGQQARNVGGAGIPVHCHDGEQHQHRADEGVEKELVAGLDALGAAPDTDDQEHRQQRAFEEHIEHRQIERGEHADHQRLEDQEYDHVFLEAVLDFPACQHGKRHQQSGQHHEQHRNAVDTDAITNGVADPGLVHHELEARIGRIERLPHGQRGREHHQRDAKCDPADGADRLLRHEQQHYRASERQPGEGCEDGIGKIHQISPPAAMAQVSSAAMPISMAKA